MDITFVFHGEPVIPYPQDLSGHSTPVGVRSKGTLVNIHLYLLSLPGIHTSEQNHVMVPLVQNASTQEGTGC